MKTTVRSAAKVAAQRFAPIEPRRCRRSSQISVRVAKTCVRRSSMFRLEDEPPRRVRDSRSRPPDDRAGVSQRCRVHLSSCRCVVDRDEKFTEEPGAPTNVSAHKMTSSVASERPMRAGCWKLKIGSCKNVRERQSAHRAPSAPTNSSIDETHQPRPRQRISIALVNLVEYSASSACCAAQRAFRHQMCRLFCACANGEIVHKKPKVVKNHSQ